MSMNPYHGTTRQAMERVGKALPRKEYRCSYGCGFRATHHDEMHHHQVDLCHWRPGSTVKKP
jgi:hypothetical protein